MSLEEEVVLVETSLPSATVQGYLEATGRLVVFRGYGGTGQQGETCVGQCQANFELGSKSEILRQSAVGIAPFPGPCTTEWRPGNEATVGIYLTLKCPLLSPPHTPTHIIHARHTYVVSSTLHHGAAVVILRGEGRVGGLVRMVQVTPDRCVVEGTVDGLAPGQHDIRVHQYGDLSEGCER